ncbi:CDP-archaeol synthase [Candidatus Woesearchaeota archaeon]|nr:CDP-archaeol synthase [Candidatus Woesearchaeota archaeon]
MEESFLILVLKCFYFILPAYFANMAPVIVKNINFLKVPIDFGNEINNKPIFGKNKTFRGLFFGILFAVIITYLQFVFHNNNFLENLVIVDYSNWLIIGFLMGSGAIIGDLIESFAKRRLGYESGKPFVPFDQTDFIIGALVFVYPVINLGISKVTIILTLSFFLHIFVNHIAFYTGIRNEKW